MSDEDVPILVIVFLMLLLGTGAIVSACNDEKDDLTQEEFT